MNKIISLIVLLFFSIFSNSESQVSVRKNIEILDSLNDIHTERIVKTFNNIIADSIYININDNPSADYIRQSIFEGFKKKNICITSLRDDKSNVLNIIIKDVDVRYGLYKGSKDSVSRNIKVEMGGTYQNNTGQLLVIESKIESFNDVIARDDIDNIKSFHKFANARVPEVPKTLFEEITEPLIIVTSAIIVVVLLFTVRSG
jgi:hypothetical protein